MSAQAAFTTIQHVETTRLRTYRNQKAWQEIQAFLPEDMRFNDQYRPREEHWHWNGHAIHLDRFDNQASRFKVIQLHGIDTNGRQLSLIAGGPLWKRGFATVAIDLPGYGMTSLNPKRPVTYQDWVQLVSDFIDAEIAKDGRPVVLYGLSAGGMLAYHAAALNRKVAGIIGMTFLNQQAQTVRDRSASSWMMSRAGGPLASLLARTRLADIRLPMWITSKMHIMVNNPQALRVFLADETSAGNWASMAFLDSYLSYQPAIKPENFTICPILLTQPERDQWTPLFLSEIFLDRLTKVKKDVVILQNAGHYPLEQPGLAQMEEAMVQFIGKLTPKKLIH